MEKTFRKHIFNEGAVPKMYKEHLKFNNKKIKCSVKKMRRSEQLTHQKTIKIANTHMKRLPKLCVKRVRQTKTMMT